MRIVTLLPTALVALLLPAFAQAQSLFPYRSDAVTRASFVRMVMEEYDLSESGSWCFTDVTDQSFASVVCAARRHGLVTGDPSGKFRPYDAITFVEAAAIVVRAERVAIVPEPLWYGPYLRTVGGWGAVPASVQNVLNPLTSAEAEELIRVAAEENRLPQTDKEVSFTITASDDTPESGDRVTFRIRMENRTNRDLRDVDVTAELEDGMEFVSASDGGDDIRDDVEWDRLDVDARSSRTILLTVDIDDDARDGDTMRLRVRSDGESVTKSLRVSGQADADVRIDVSDDPDSVEAGEIVTYRIRVENREDDRISTTVRAFLDPDTRFVSASDDVRLTNDTVSWNSVRLDEDETHTFVLRVRVDEDMDDGESVRLRVEADGDEEEEMTEVENDHSSGSADVRIGITDSPDPVWLGDALTYRISIENLEDHDISIDVRAFLDGETTYLTASHDADEDDLEVTWRDIRIDRGETETMSLTVRVGNRVRHGDELRLRVEAGSDEESEATAID